MCFTALQDYFTNFEPSQSLGGAKTGDPREKPYDHPQAELGLSHKWPERGSNPAALTTRPRGRLLWERQVIMCLHYHCSGVFVLSPVWDNGISPFLSYYLLLPLLHLSQDEWPWILTYFVFVDFLVMRLVFLRSAGFPAAHFPRVGVGVGRGK